MFRRNNKIAAWPDRGVDGGEQAANVLDVVQGEGTIGEVEAGLRQCQLFEVSQPVGDVAGILRLRLGQHVCGYVQAEHVCGALVYGPAGEPAETAAEVCDLQAVEVRQHLAD